MAWGVASQTKDREGRRVASHHSRAVDAPSPRAASAASLRKRPKRHGPASGVRPMPDTVGREGAANIAPGDGVVDDCVAQGPPKARNEHQPDRRVLGKTDGARPIEPARPSGPPRGTV
ncbi:hypothetical protein [Lysobacter sp. cf310]|uniref:hypothetical protein n=1 Tax=Lysobacter sp. cf310 TaxID=1761790 RepID=UPI0008E107A5|nr:hypothetical protein [Lysobacter sp. cf310]SFK49533.1 hypothetical protein SAMN04487938_1086 [Lysobacter sp. cf310]